MIKVVCSACGRFATFPNDFGGKSGRCTCGQIVSVPLAEPRAHAIKQSDSIGYGCLLEAVGIIIFLLGVASCSPLALLLCPLGIWIVVVGERNARWQACSECGTKLNRVGRICPGCRARVR